MHGSQALCLCSLSLLLVTIGVATAFTVHNLSMISLTLISLKANMFTLLMIFGAFCTNIINCLCNMLQFLKEAFNNWEKFIYLSIYLNEISKFLTPKLQNVFFTQGFTNYIRNVCEKLLVKGLACQILIAFSDIKWNFMFEIRGKRVQEWETGAPYIYILYGLGITTNTKAEQYHAAMCFQWWKCKPFQCLYVKLTTLFAATYLPCFKFSKLIFKSLWSQSITKYKDIKISFKGEVILEKFISNSVLTILPLDFFFLIGDILLNIEWNGHIGSLIIIFSPH